MSEFLARMGQHYAFTRQEFKGILIVSLVAGIVLGFDDGQPSFELLHWLINMAICIGIATVSILLHISAQKAMALMKGYLLEYGLFMYGIIGGVVLGLASLGKLILMPAFNLVFIHHEGLRLGRFRYGLNYFEMATVAMMGPIANFLLAIILKLLYAHYPLFPVGNALRFNVMFAIANLLPIPKTPGSYLFFGSPALYFWIFAPITISGVLLLVLPALPALISGLLAGAVVALVYFFRFEYR